MMAAIKKSASRSAPNWFAGIILLIAIGALAGVIHVASQQHASDKRAFKAELAARVKQCEQGNSNRYGGRDYTRPVVRALVEQVGIEKIRTAIILQGFPGTLADLRDLPQINCTTGKEIPIKGGR
jgi:hypothetical protein